MGNAQKMTTKRTVKTAIAIVMIISLMLPLAGCMSPMMMIKVNKLNQKIEEAITNKEFTESKLAEIDDDYAALSDEGKEHIEKYEMFKYQVSLNTLMEYIKNGEWDRAALKAAEIADKVSNEDGEALMEVLKEAVLTYGPELENEEQINQFITIITALGLENTNQGKTMISLLYAYIAKEKLSQSIEAAEGGMEPVKEWISGIASEIFNKSDEISDWLSDAYLEMEQEIKNIDELQELLQ